jgi:group II intron reverse transcriptase/maturase
MEQGKSTKYVKGMIQIGKTSIRSNTKDLVDGGLNRSSDETSVMDVERRVEIIQQEIPFTTSINGRRIYSIFAKGIPITKSMVWQAYKKVRSNKGSGGIDGISLDAFKSDLNNNLYKLWNRLSSGSYFPKAVREVLIPKKDGKMRKLGIPTIEDRIAQQVIKDYLESRFEAVFHPNSYGYRPLKSAHQALEQVRQNVRKNDWVIDMDIKGFFDEVSHDLLMKALDRHVHENWVILYIKRWLNSPTLTESKDLRYRNGKGTPQGGVISPLLANLFLHYVFDKWLNLIYPNLSFVRYADDIIVHCSNKEEAKMVLASIKERMTNCNLQLHEKKTKIAFCKKYKKRSSHKIVKFDFLGFSFQPRPTALKNMQLFLGFDCAISLASEKRICDEIKSTNFHNWTNRSISEIADFFNPKLKGWIQYYGKFRKHTLNRFIKIFQARLVNWASKRYKRFNGSYLKAFNWISRLKDGNPFLFVHWNLNFIFT